MPPLTRRFHILLVDNDAASARRSTEWLVEAGYAVSRRESLQGIDEAMAVLQPDFILLDVLMPHLAGKDVEAFLQQHPATSSCPVVLSSPMHPAVLRRMISTANALGVISNTGGPDQLLATLRTYTSWIEMRDLLRRPAASGVHRVQAIADVFYEEDTTTERTGNS